MYVGVFVLSSNCPEKLVGRVPATSSVRAIEKSVVEAQGVQCVSPSFFVHLPRTMVL
jgi:hypothetical protein